MPLYIADQFAELTRFDPDRDQIIPGMGRRIVAVEAVSIEQAREIVLRDARDIERDYMRMSVDFKQHLLDLGMSQEALDGLGPLSGGGAFDDYRLLGVGNFAQVPGDLSGFETPGSYLLRCVPLPPNMDGAGRRAAFARGNA